MNRHIFHLSIPVLDLVTAKRFYVEVLGATVGRQTEGWLDILLWGHQITLQLRPEEVLPLAKQGNRHFGVVLPWADWEREVQRIERLGIGILETSSIKMAGTNDEHGKLYLHDPSGNVIELEDVSERSADFGARVSEEGFAADAAGERSARPPARLACLAVALAAAGCIVQGGHGHVAAVGPPSAAPGPAPKVARARGGLPVPPGGPVPRPSGAPGGLTVLPWAGFRAAVSLHLRRRELVADRALRGAAGARGADDLLPHHQQARGLGPDLGARARRRARARQPFEPPPARGHGRGPRRRDRLHPPDLRGGSLDHGLALRRRQLPAARSGRASSPTVAW